MTDLRDAFAIAALQGMLAQFDGDEADPAYYAPLAYQFADAMMISRGDLAYLNGYLRSANAREGE